MVSNKVAVMVQSSQPSSRPSAGSAAHIRKMYTKVARPKPTAATMEGIAVSSRAVTPHIVDDPFFVTKTKAKVSSVYTFLLCHGFYIGCLGLLCKGFLREKKKRIKEGKCKRGYNPQSESS